MLALLPLGLAWGRISSDFDAPGPLGAWEVMRIAQVQQWIELVPPFLQKMLGKAPSVFEGTVAWRDIASKNDAIYWDTERSLLMQLASVSGLWVGTRVPVSRALVSTRRALASFTPACLRGPLGFVEAFDPHRTTIASVREEAISLEFVETGRWKRGWTYAFSRGHWPTIYWMDTREEPSWIPLVGNNTLQGLRHLGSFGVKQQAGLGMIFGVIDSGWQVQMGLSDTEGDPWYFDEQGKALKSDRFEGRRWFALFNVRPGSRVLYVRSQDLSGGVALPVLAGSASYLNLTQVSSSGRLSGVLFDENDDEAEPAVLAGSTVRVIGQSAVAITDTQGKFQFDHLVTVGSYPLYIESYKAVETVSGQLSYLGYTHRYRIFPDAMQDLALFRVSRAQMRVWKQQWGEVGDMGGMVVAAFMHPDRFKSTMRLVPTTQSLLPHHSGILTASIGNDGVLGNLGSFLSAHHNRVVSTQIPEGPAVMRLGDVSRGNVWQELFFAAPNVVTVLGPYQIDTILPSSGLRGSYE